MVYCLTVCLVTDDQTVIDAIKAKIKNRTDAQLWKDDPSWNKSQYVNRNGHIVFRGEMRFLAEADMTTALNWMISKAILYKPLLIGIEGEYGGSFMEAHTCANKKVADGTHTGEDCTITYRWDK